MAVVEEILRSEADGSISFGNHKLAKKAKVEDYEHAGDLLKVKTYNEMTKLEKNGMFLYESVPGTSVLEFKESDNSVEFIVEGDEDSQITVGLKDDTEYEVFIDGKNVGTMETGLGGRLDSTNALGNPMVAVITRIGYDHMAILGNTLTEIASEKAGILKENVPAIFAPQDDEALAVLQKHPGTLVSGEDMEKVAFMKPGLMGEYQLENGAAAMLAAQKFLSQIGFDEERADAAIEAGIHTAIWKGRMEILSREPYLMVDGAHNSNGIHALKTSLMKLYPDEKFHFVMGVMADKDYEKMIEELLSLAIDFVTVTPESSRALQAESLAEKIRSQGIPARSMASVADVLTLPRVGEKTIALGSLYFIGELEAIYYGNT